VRSTVVEVIRLCVHCGRELRPGLRKTARFCDGVHRQRAYRRRRVAVPETRPRQQPTRGLTLREAYLDWQRKNDLTGFLLDRYDEWEADLATLAARVAEGEAGAAAAVLANAAADDAFLADLVARSGDVRPRPEPYTTSAELP
jgi:hypothetical protein